MSRTIENDEFGALVNRLTKAYVKRLNAGADVDDLIYAQKVAKEFQRQLKLTAIQLWKDGKCSGPRAGEALGMTRQGFHKLQQKHA
jgi:hypothetical protein